MRLRRLLLVLGLCASTVAWCLSDARAQNIWTGLGADDNWGTAANWQADDLPPQEGNFGTDVQFDLPAGGTSNAQAIYKLNSITFGAGAGAFTITGAGDERIRVDNWIRNDSTTLQTFSAGITIRPQGTAEPTIDAAAGDILIDSSANRELHLYALGVIFTGANTTTVDRTNTSNTVTTTEAAVIKNGTGNLVLLKNGSYNGFTEINDGRIHMKHQGALGNASGNTRINDGGMIYLLSGADGGDIAEPIVLNGDGYSGQGALRSGNATTFDWTGTVDLASDTRIATDGNSQINLTGTIDGPGGLQKNGSGTLRIANGQKDFSGDVTVNGGLLIADKAPQLLGTGDLYVNSGGTLEVRWANAILPSQLITLNGGFADMRLNGNSADWDNDINVSADSRLRVRQQSSGIKDHGFGTVTWTAGVTLDIDRSDSHTASFDAFDVTGVDAARIGGAPITVGTVSGTGGGDHRIFFNEGTATITGPVNLTSLRVGNNGGDLNATVNYDGGGNTLATSGEFHVANNNGATGTYVFNLQSGIVDVGSHVHVGRNDNSTATMNINGGAFDIDLDLKMAIGIDSDARVNVDAGTLTVGRNVTDSDNGASTIEVAGGTLDLTGGNLTVDRLIYRSGNINNVNQATLKGGNAVNFALMMRGNVDVDFPVTLQQGMRWENDDHGTGLISATVDLDGGTREFRVQNGNNTVDLSVDGVISNGGLTKAGNGLLLLTADNTYAGATSVDAGTLRVDGSIAASSGVTVASGATLSGYGTVPVIGGAGLVSPGASPGILSAAAIDPTGGTGYAFEFTTASPPGPDYTQPATSLNDVLRLSDPTAPFTADLAAANLVDVYLNVPDLAVGDRFRGGFYTDRGSNFVGQIENATFNYFVRGDGNGNTVFEGVNYYSLAEFAAIPAFDVLTVLYPTNFGAGPPVAGYVMQLTAVPEPSSAVLGLLAALGLGWFGLRRKR